MEVAPLGLSIISRESLSSSAGGCDSGCCDLSASTANATILDRLALAE